MRQLSTNFREPEFYCHGCGILHAPVHPQLITFLQTIRDNHGRPILVTSGSRCAGRQILLKEADSSSRVAVNSPHTPRICEDGKYYTLAADLACFRHIAGETPYEKQQRNRDFIRSCGGSFANKCRIGWKKYVGRNFLHVDFAYLVSRNYIKQLAVKGDERSVNRMLASWREGVEW